MKNIFAGVLACTAAVLLHSCSEDFNVAAPYKEVTVGYGLLNMADTAHYIRVQKAFLDETKSAVEMAQVSDSSYYTALEVRMKELSSTGSVVSETVLPRVSLDAEGYPKQPGAFFTVPNYAYKYRHTLDPANRYRLVIRNSSTGKTDSAETAVISSNPADDPSDFSVYQFRQAIFDIVFENGGRPNGTFYINIKAPANARLYEGIIRFRWVDRNTQTGEQTDHYADWSFASLDNEGAALTMSTDQSGFYTFLANAMQSPPANTERYMDSCDMFVWAATADLYMYRQYEMAAGGLTGGQIKPHYTNFKGDNVLGLFASRAMKAKLQIPINPTSLDSLKVNPVTQSLNIRGVADH